MSYVSLYRKYRSQTFEEVIGQDHVTKTLQNAIRLGKVAHAYLFAGTRGTGKTTTARLLAKSLNCETGPTPNPCNKCAACIAISEGSAMDIIEMDAASHRGVRDVEQIRENVKYPPMELRYKVFIIDEAHQLSNDAKDAFLKTLEEPPPHAIFILATTEPQSIPITIRSRCQQFEFRRGSLHDIISRLKAVANGEGIEVDEPAFELMAASAEGSWRDAISLLEQVLAYTDGRITVEDINTVLGTVTRDFLFHLADAIADGDEKNALEAVAQAVDSGKDIQQLLKSIAEHFRDLMYIMVAKNSSGLTATEDTAEQLRRQAEKFNRQSLLRTIEILTTGQREIRYSDQDKLILEITLLKTIDCIRSPEVITPSAPKVQSRHPVREPVLEMDQPTQTPHPTPTQQDLPPFDTIKANWNRVLQHLKPLSKPAYSLMMGAQPAGVRNGALVLHFRHESHAKLISADPERGENEKKKALLQAIEHTFGVANVRLICEVGTVGPQSTTEPPASNEEDSEEDLPDPFADDGNGVLKNVLEMFDGRIVE